MHFGHANAFRQARAIGDELVVGMNMDEEIVRIKVGCFFAPAG
jgi:cytidyltransferase-like protein